MDPRIEAQATNFRIQLRDILIPIRESLGHAAKMAWDQNLLRSIAADKDMIRIWEKKTRPLDWEHLESWIEDAVQSFRSLYQARNNALIALGMGESDLCIDSTKSITFELEKIKSAPLVQALRRSYGPKWLSRLGSLDPLSYDGVYHAAFSSDDNYPKLNFHRPAQQRAEHILSKWRKLREMKADRMLDRVQERWEGLGTVQRSEWLEQKHPQLPRFPHGEIYKWAKSSDIERTSLDKRLFMMPLINIEDLTQNTVLSALLNARSTWHPGLFRSIDGRSISLGLYSSSLKFRVGGGMSFKRVQDEESYGIVLRDETNPNQLPSPSEVGASLGVLQLEAQCQTYDFLVSFSRELLDEGFDDWKGGLYSDTQEQASSHTRSDDCLSLLTQSSRLDYYGRPEAVDVEYLDSLLKASYEEALDELWQLRLDSNIGSTVGRKR
jgi:hypothetical protein